MKYSLKKAGNLWHIVGNY